MKRVAFQMDPVTEVNIATDSSFRLAEEAFNRGYELWFYEPKDLYFDQGGVFAKAAKASVVQRVQGSHVALGKAENLDLSELDCIWLRQDPPFDMAYITSTHLLERLTSNVLIVNDPKWVRNLPEKLSVLDFPDLTPPTMIASDLEHIKRFRDQFGDIIIKPLYGNGGAGVFKLDRHDPNISSLFELFSSFSREPLIAQQYLPDVSKGDKRIILVDGEPVGAINRIPPVGEARSNMHVGGKAEASGMSERDLEICARIGPSLKERGQIFVGIDVIGGLLTEINVTSPTGLQELEKFDGTNASALIWDAIEKRLIIK